MKIAASAVGPDKEAKVELRFGRAKTYMIYDTEAKEWSVLENEVQMDLPHGAGIQTAQNIARAGIQAVITGHCGPNAHRALTAANISLYFVGSRTVREAIDEFLAGKLKLSEGADVQGHW
jgi:predicted Fe-Mo cluster-binding NifX family protein